MTGAVTPSSRAYGRAEANMRPVATIAAIPASLTRPTARTVAGENSRLSARMVRSRSMATARTEAGMETGAARIPRAYPSIAMDAADKRLCDLIQNEFPVVERPYAAIGERLGMGEGEVIDRVQRLRGERIIRQVSAIFDTRKLGYRSMLVAARAPAERADEAAEVISTHPGVTHNYERKHEY